jgi:two-component system LytT family response regulator
MRVLIVDDEPLAREGIALRLHGQRDVEIVGSIGDPEAAVAAIRRLAPQVLFLDVQMPGRSGFDVLAEAGADRVPVVIFVTAHDHYALRAFRAHAADYLLKPIDDAQFTEALVRARDRLASMRFRETAARLRALIDDVAAGQRAAGAAPSRIALRSRGGVRFIACGDIEWIEGHGDYVKVHAGGEPAIVREKIRELQQRLSPAEFVRIHRSAIVGVRHVRAVEPRAHGEFVLVTTSGRQLKVSRTHRAALTRALGSAR